MASAVAARIQGDDYQGRVFWIQACRLFDERTKVTKVEIESTNIKSLDDVVVHYEGVFDTDQPIAADYYQVKFHVTAGGAFTWEAMMDPGFINAASVSLLQRLRNAQQAFAPDGWGCRFFVYSPWSVHPDDAMADFLAKTDGRIVWRNLSEGGERSRMGTVRAAWRRHLALETDEDLRRVLEPIRILTGPTLDELAEKMNLYLRIAGLRPVEQGTIGNPYDDLARKFIAKGRTSFTRQKIEDICRREGLWVGRAIPEPRAVRLGIRSFWRFAQHLEDETDAMLCLLKHFHGRAPKDPALWSEAVVPDVECFLREHALPGSRYHIRLQTHSSVAFLAGWTLDPKSGVDIVPVQDNTEGRHVWRPKRVSDRQSARYPMWRVEISKSEAPTGAETVVAVSVTHDILTDVETYVLASLGRSMRIIHFRMPDPGSLAVVDGTHARILAEAIVKRVLKERTAAAGNGLSRMFFAAPNGLLFFLGRLARPLGRVVLYEHDFEAGGPTYYQAIELRAESLLDSGKSPPQREEDQ